MVTGKILKFHCWMDGHGTEFGLAGSTGMAPADRIFSRMLKSR